MKNIGKIFIALFGFALCASGSYAKDSVEDAYDLYAPSGKSTDLWLQISGETKRDRISFEKGKNPLVVKDEEGKLMEKDPNYETKYVPLNFYGGEDNRAFNLHCRIVAPADKWTKYVMTFKPRKSGKIIIKLGPWMGRQFYPDKTFYKYGDLAYGRFAKIEGINVKFKDPDFKQPKTWGFKKYYYFRNLKSEVVDDAEAPGGKCLRGIGQVYQEVQVKAGVPVTITFYYKPDDYFKAKK